MYHSRHLVYSLQFCGVVCNIGIYNTVTDTGFMCYVAVETAQMLICITVATWCIHCSSVVWCVILEYITQSLILVLCVMLQLKQRRC